MPPFDCITVDPEILAGKPVIRGTRLAVEFILEQLAAGQSEQELLASYPGLMFIRFPQDALALPPLALRAT